MSNQRNDIIHRTFSGFSWNIVGNILRSVAGFVINILLARLLGPEPFGIVAIALIVIGIGTLIIESGLGAALIQTEDLDDADIAFIFTLQMGIGILLTFGVFISAPWLAMFFSNPAVTNVMRVLAFLMIVQAFVQVPTALLRRHLNFKRLQQSQIISYLAGYLGLGLPLALAGWGVWSLVIAQFTQAILNAAITYSSCRYSLKLSLRNSKQLFGFGIRVLGANVANWVIQNVDNMIIGRQFGTTALGFYSRSYFLSWTPLGIILTSAQMALFSSVSRNGRGSNITQIFLAFFAAFAVFLLPAYTLVALGAEEFILLIYGKNWLPAADLLVPLALAMPLFALMGLEGPVLNGLGKPGIELRIQWVVAVIAVMILYVASKISLQAVAWSIIAIYFIRLMLMTYQTISALDLQVSQFLYPFLSGLLLAAGTVITWVFVSEWVPNDSGVFFRLLMQGSLAASVWLIVLILGRKWLFPEFKSMVNLYFKSEAYRAE